MKRGLLLRMLWGRTEFKKKWDKDRGKQKKKKNKKAEAEWHYEKHIKRNTERIWLQAKTVANRRHFTDLQCKRESRVNKKYQECFVCFGLVFRIENTICDMRGRGNSACLSWVVWAIKVFSVWGSSIWRPRVLRAGLCQMTPDGTCWFRMFPIKVVRLPDRPSIQNAKKNPSPSRWRLPLET